MPDRVVVRVPATVANLGPGFDALGLSLSWHNHVTVERSNTFAVSAAGSGAEEIARDRTNLVVRALAAVIGVEQPRVRVHQMLSIAYGRGFGSSAAAIVGGLVAGRALAGTAHSDDDLLRLAVDIEGHADNAAPCLLGGVAVSAGSHIERIAAPSGIEVLVCVAPTRLSTKAARGVLPDQVPRAAAVANVGRAALLATSLALGRVDALLEATDDLLHQPYRFELMPDSGMLVERLRAEGVAAFLSGAGPSVAALVATDAVKRAESLARSIAPEGWSVRVETFDGTGATVVEQR